MISGFLFPTMGLCGARSRNRTGTPVLEATDFKNVIKYNKNNELKGVFILRVLEC